MMRLLMRRGFLRRPRSRSRGQAIVEFALIMPTFLIILMSALEFGSAYDHRTAMAYAVREGARVGASLGNGSADANPSAVDPAIIAAVQRGLTAPILLENVTSIQIFKSDLNGNAVAGLVNTYDRDGVLIGTAGWPATSRSALNGDSIGVLVRYDFHPTTPLGSLISLFFGGAPPYTTLPMTDATVMRLEPTP
jgi:Flp pilus assembly protein TadG